MKKVYISLGVMVVCIIAAVFLRKAMNSVELDYQEVKARVVSSESRQKRIRVNGRTTTQTVYDVVVSYGGKEYDLKNAHNTYMYREGADATVYLSKGKMYADLAGVRNSTPAGIADIGLALLQHLFWLCAGGQRKVIRKKAAVHCKKCRGDSHFYDGSVLSKIILYTGK